jgi:hypothetical protein
MAERRKIAPNFNVSGTDRLQKENDLKRNTFKILFSEVWAYISIIILLQILPGKSCLLLQRA